jgi:uncharacterized membrane protein
VTKFLLSVHVLAAILFIGPVTVAASMFPPVARRALAATTEPAVSDAAVLRTLHRISFGYAVAGLTVPVFGIAVGNALKVLGETWLIASIVLTVLAAGILAFVVLPTQARIVAAVGEPAEVRGSILPRARTLSMTTGIFALLWTVVVVLMIVRPGSTTGA